MTTVTLKNYHCVSRGLAQGSLNLGESEVEAEVRSGYYEPFERRAYLAGWRVGKRRQQELMAAPNRLEVAIKRGWLKSKGLSFYRGSVEEIDANAD